MSLFRTSMLAATLAGPLLASAMPDVATQTSFESGIAPGTLQDELLQMAGQAGVIFVGEVLSVTPHPSFTPAAGTVEIAFRIDQPIRGCDGQSRYVLREWAGLWVAGHQRYAPGQRLLMLLHTPSASGLSSPVGGQDGVIPVIGTGIAPRPNDTIIAQAEPSVDLRWVQARLPRAAVALQNSRLHALTASSLSNAREHTPLALRKITAPGVLRSTISAPNLVENTSTLPLASTAAKGISLRSILSILGAWQAQQSNAAH